jgi:hypothetical protein
VEYENSFASTQPMQRSPGPAFKVVKGKGKRRDGDEVSINDFPNGNVLKLI